MKRFHPRNSSSREVRSAATRRPVRKAVRKEPRKLVLPGGHCPAPLHGAVAATVPMARSARSCCSGLSGGVLAGDCGALGSEQLALRACGGAPFRNSQCLQRKAGWAPGHVAPALHPKKGTMAGVQARAHVGAMAGCQVAGLSTLMEAQVRGRGRALRPFIQQRHKCKVLSFAQRGRKSTPCKGSGK